MPSRKRSDGSRIKTLAASIIQSAARKFLSTKNKQPKKPSRKEIAAGKILRSVRRYQAKKSAERDIEKRVVDKSKIIDLRRYVRRCKELTVQDLSKVDYQGRTFLHYLADEHNTLKKPEFKDYIQEKNEFRFLMERERYIPNYNYNPKEPDFFQCLDIVIAKLEGLKGGKLLQELLNMKDKKGQTPLSLAVLNMPYDYDRNNFNYRQLFSKIRLLSNMEEMKKETFDKAYDIYINKVLPRIKHRYDENWLNNHDMMKDIKENYYSHLIMTEKEKKEVEKQKDEERRKEREEYDKEIEFIKNNPCKSDNYRNGGRGYCEADDNCSWCANPKNRKKRW